MELRSAERPRGAGASTVGGTALIGSGGELLGIGSLQLQHATRRGAGPRTMCVLLLLIRKMTKMTINYDSAETNKNKMYMSEP